MGFQLRLLPCAVNENPSQTEWDHPDHWLDPQEATQNQIKALIVLLKTDTCKGKLKQIFDKI